MAVVQEPHTFGRTRANSEMQCGSSSTENFESVILPVSELETFTYNIQIITENTNFRFIVHTALQCSISVLMILQNCTKIFFSMLAD
jgi:hypothetical protein